MPRDSSPPSAAAAEPRLYAALDEAAGARGTWVVTAAANARPTAAV